MPDSSHFLRSLLALLFVLASVPAAATTWACWYNLDQHVACLLRRAPAAGPLRAGEQRLLAEAAPIRVAAAWGRPALPPIVQLLRTRAGAFRGRILYIPLHSEPIDHRLVAVLAQSVMCGAEPGCQASYGERLDETPEMAADFADANDPLLAMES